MHPNTDKTKQKYLQKTNKLSAWLFLAVVLNVLLATGTGHGGDVGFWVDWISQLQLKGYAELQANYPPLYIHWLWILAQGYAAFEIAPAAGDLLRMLANTPVLVAHLILIRMVDTFLRESGANDQQWRFAIAFTVLNPALLLDGPLWGQVDLIFCTFIVFALHSLISGRYLLLSFPLLAIALLTKFQTISVLPVILALLWHQRKAPRLWQGLLFAGAISLLLLLPYLLAGSAFSMFEQAYLKASSLYPLATMNATNLWYLLDLNFRPDTISLLSPDSTASGLGLALTPKWLGLGSCALWCLYLLIDSLKHNDEERLWRNAILCATGFFVLLPGMHERYLVPAVVIALVAAARHPALRLHAIALSLLSAANIIIILQPQHGLLPYTISAATVLFAFWFVATEQFKRFFFSSIITITNRAWSVLALIFWITPIAYHLNLQLPDSDGWVNASRLPGISSQQEWGALQLDKAISGGMLNINGQRFKSGFGTHAASNITLMVPQGAIEFSVFAGLDQAAGAGGMARFLIFIDGVLSWDGGNLNHASHAREARIPLNNARKIELRVDSMGDNYRDHANWANPRFYLPAKR